MDNPRIASRAAKSSPQEEDMKDWSNIKDAFAWVGFKQRDADVVASLLALIQYESDDPLVELATMDTDDFVDDLKNWTVDGRPAASGDNRPKI